MSQNLRPARVVPPGRILSRELEARGWTQKELAEIIGRPPQVINEIIRGTKQITPETALELSAALGTSAEFWTNLEANYRLHIARTKKNDPGIARKSALYSLAPIQELIKRKWIRAADSTEQLEVEVCNFLGISSLDEFPKLTVNFRHAQERKPEANAQIAWLKRVEYLAKQQTVAPFDLEKLKAAIPTLLTLSVEAEDVAKVPHFLLDLGVHFLIVPHLSKTYIDGAAFYLNGHPVVVLTLRYDRIDAFWFTLMHELAHIIAGHQGFHVDNFDDRDLGSEEDEANQLACDWLIESAGFTNFVEETKPYFSKEVIQHFAHHCRRHPGIVLGRLHKEELVSYKNLRQFLVKVSPFLTGWIDEPVANDS
uniref:HigA family addiction module antitoxin n=1 Tax=Trichocoleus desertorum TaxID=1481672 RepID=UPI0025B4A670|nr:HigA family addiction module antitoxin [Trichocoleus desertorum]